MASANLDLVRSICADWERGDFSSVEWAHPQIVFEGDGFDGGKSTGVADMSERWREWMSAWDDVRTDVEEYREFDSQRVLAFTGRGKRSGLELGPISATSAILFQVRDGKMTRLVTYWDRDRALADLEVEK